MRSLPSLNGLRSFEAAARLNSFTAAATELHVTQAAISRSIKALEAQLGYRLFERHANSLALTIEATDLLPDVTGALDRLAGATRRVEASRARPILTIGVGPTFAVRWLIPRLGRLQELLPDIEVHTATAGPSAALSSAWTCSVRLGADDTPGVVSVPLFSPLFFPVCSPRIASKLKKPADLASATLLDVAHMPEDWSEWLQKAGVNESAINRRSVFDYHSFALQAAVDGLGVAIGFEPYVADDIASGRLVRPFELAVLKQSGWHLNFRQQVPHNPVFEKFKTWILKEAGQTTRAMRKAAGPPKKT